MVIPQSIPSQMSQGQGKKTELYQTPDPLLCQTADQQCQSSHKEEKVEKEMTPVVSPLIHQKRKRTKTVFTPPTVHPQSFVSKEKQREDITSDKLSVTSAAHITTGFTSSVHNTNAKSRQVCFSRRRSILFRKAYELSVLCGVHVKVVTFSPAGKLYSCAYPSNSNSLNSMFAKDKDLLDQNVVSISNSQTDNLSRQVSELTTKAAKKKNEALKAIVKYQYIMSADVSKMELVELKALKKRLEQALAG